MILPLVCIGYLELTFSDLKQLILNQTEQNGYQTVPFSVYIRNLMGFFSFLSEYSENSLGTVVILPLVCIGYLELTFSDLKQLILNQTEQNGYQTVPFSVYIRNLMFFFSFLSEYSENSLGAAVNLPLVCIGYLELTFSDLKQLILDQTEQNGYQTVPFSVYIHNLMFFFSFLSEYSENSLGAAVNLPLVCIGYLELTFSDLKQLILDQTEQNGYQTVPFCVYIHNLMFAFIFDQVF